VLFPTITFAVFFLVVYVANWALMPRPRLWKQAIIVASCVFYGWWDWRLIFLLLGATLVNQALGVRVYRAAGGRGGRRPAARPWLMLAVAVNLATLGVFKYFDFFALSLNGVLAAFGLGAPLPLLRIALPVGISFLVFRMLTYVIDIYRGQLTPAPALDFAVYTVFFPYLLAGPIARAREFLPQLREPRDPRAVDSSRAFVLILGGLVKKLLIADYLSTHIVGGLFASPQTYSSWETFWGILAYSVQIYCDFSAYSDIAIGVSLLLGFRLPDNFDRPYAARSVQEFWRRWHMTLSRWLRDYLYIPLGGNRHGRLNTYRNRMITMLLGGLWHGAAWTFVIWGGLHGLYLSAAKLIGIRPMEEQIRTPRQLAAFGLRVLVTFHLVCLGWVFFRAGSLDQAWLFLTGLAHATTAVELRLVFVTAFYMSLMLLIDLPCWVTNEEYPLTARTRWYVRGMAQAAAVILISFVGAGNGAAFIYFRF